MSTGELQTWEGPISGKSGIVGSYDTAFSWSYLYLLDCTLVHCDAVVKACDNLSTWVHVLFCCLSTYIYT